MLQQPLFPVRLAKKLKFSGWLELVYFIKFNITMPKLDVTNDIDYMSVQPEEALTPLLASLKQQRILIHGSGFSQLIAQYIYNKFLVTGVNASRRCGPITKSSNRKTPPASTPSGSFLNPGAAARRSTGLRPRGKEINLVCFTGDYQSPLAQAADTAFIIHDPQKFDDDIYWSNPFFGYCILGFERLLKMWFTSLRSNS